MKYLIPFLLISLNLHAFQMELIARSREADSYGVMRGAHFDNVTPAINDLGDIAFNLHAIAKDSGAGIWYKKYGSKGQIIYEAKDGHYISDVAISNNRTIAFYEYSPDEHFGVYTFDTNTGELKTIATPDTMKDFWSFSNVSIDDDDRVFFRVRGDSTRAIYSSIYGELRELQKGGDYLYAPKINRYGDLIYKMDMNGLSKLILQKGEYLTDISLHAENLYAIGTLGQMLYIKGENRKRSLMFKDVISHKSILTEGTQNILEFEPFYPVINGWNQAALRILNSKKIRQVYYYDSETFTPILSEGELVKSDLGISKIMLKDGYPGFSGGLSMNDRGDILVHVILTDEFDDKYLGEAIYLIAP